MYSVATDLFSTLEVLVRDNNVDAVVIVEESPEYPGELIFQPTGNEQEFYRAYKDWVSRYLVLNQLFNLDSFVTKLKEDGYTIIFAPNTTEILRNIERWKTPLYVEGYDFYPFQSFSLRRAIEQTYYFFNWSAGAGKSYCSAAGAKYLMPSCDIVLVFTLSKLKEDMRRFFEKAGLDAVVNDGTPAARAKRIHEGGHQVYINNYEKSWVDYDLMVAQVTDKKVLFILDECHKVVTDGTQNKSRKAIDKLIKVSESRVWPMSASVVGGNPLKYRDVFSVKNLRRNPLGTKADFISRYADRVRTFDVRTRSGGTFKVTNYDWNLNNLQECRHRVGGFTSAVRKTDPGVREQFKGIQTIVVPIQLSPEDRKLTDEITQRAHEARERGENLMPYYRLLRYACNIPSAIALTIDPVGQEIAQEHPEMLTDKHCAKLERLNQQLEGIREAMDKVLVFCHWTDFGLHLIAPHISVPYVLHWGTGQTNRQSQAAQDKFKIDPNITCFLTSDAGTHGLNMQCSRFTLQFDVLYDFDSTMQRASRIDRADSHLDGLTNYIYVTENSVEERVWKVQEERREVTEAVQGTREVRSYNRAFQNETESLDFLIFGEE